MEGLENGYFVGPAVFTDVRRDMRIAREEIFGPVTCIIPFEDEEEAVSIANDTDFGLIAVVFTENHSRAMRVTRALDTGCVYINNFYRPGRTVRSFWRKQSKRFWTRALRGNAARIQPSQDRTYPFRAWRNSSLEAVSEIISWRDA